VEHNAKTSAELSWAVNNKIWINNWLNLQFLHLFNTLCTFWPNSILFQGLENRFHNSILSISRENSASAARVIQTSTKFSELNVTPNAVCWGASKSARQALHWSGQQVELKLRFSNLVITFCVQDQQLPVIDITKYSLYSDSLLFISGNQISWLAKNIDTIRKLR